MCCAISQKHLIMKKLILLLIEVFLAACAPRNEFCGRRAGVVGTIFGGSAVKKNSWPWITALFDRAEDKFFCAGSLINSKHVLSGKAIKKIIKLLKSKC